MSIRTATIIAVLGASLSLLIGLIYRFGVFSWSYGVLRHVALLPDVAYLVFFLVLLSRQPQPQPPKL
jgi:hypothetical protein